MEKKKDILVGNALISLTVFGRRLAIPSWPDGVYKICSQFQLPSSLSSFVLRLDKVFRYSVIMTRVLQLAAGSSTALFAAVSYALLLLLTGAHAATTAHAGAGGGATGEARPISWKMDLVFAEIRSSEESFIQLATVRYHVSQRTCMIISNHNILMISPGLLSAVRICTLLHCARGHHDIL